MPEIPFTGVPDRVPELRPTPGINVNPPEAAFGTNIAAATQHLGQIEEGAGKELFDRAYALQEMHEQSNALKGMATAQDMANDAFVQFKEKKGADAGPAALAAYHDQLDKAFDTGRAGLSPYGQLEFDKEARIYRAKMLHAGSEHSADELKSYFISSATAAQGTAMKGMELHPGDNTGNEKLLDGIRGNSHDISAAMGDPPGSPGYIKRENDAVNAALIGKIRAKGLTDSAGAMKLLDDAKSKGEVYGEDSARLYQWLQSQSRTVGARNDAHAVMNNAAGFNLSSGMVDQKTALAGLTGSEGGAAFYNWSGKDQWDQSHQNYGHPIGAYSVMSYSLQGFLRQAGMGPMTEAEFKADHAAQDQLAWTMFNQYQQKYGSADAAAIAWFAGEGSVKANLAGLSDGKTSGPEYLQRFHRGVAQGSGEAGVASAARTVSLAQFPDDFERADNTENYARTQFRKDEQDVIDTRQRDRDTVVAALVNGMGPDKKLPTTPEELQADPQVGAAWQQLGQTKGGPEIQQQILRQLAANAKGDVALTPEREKNWQQLAGLSVNDPKAFMDRTQDISKVDLPLGMKKQIIAWQRDIYKKADANPQMAHAMTYLQHTGILSAAGLTKDQAPDDLNQFTGVLHDIMSQYQLNNDKPMPDAEIESTATKLLARPHPERWFNQGSMWFKSADDIPPEFVARVQTKMPGASNDQVMKMWLAMQYNNLVNPPKVGEQ